MRAGLAVGRRLRWIPLARKPLRLLDPPLGHLFRHDVAILDGAGAFLCLRRKKPGGREVEPLVALDIVLRHPSAVVIHDAEIELGSGVSLISGLAIPP